MHEENGKSPEALTMLRHLPYRASRSHFEFSKAKPFEEYFNLTRQQLSVLLTNHSIVPVYPIESRNPCIFGLPLLHSSAFGRKKEV